MYCKLEVFKVDKMWIWRRSSQTSNSFLTTVSVPADSAMNFSSITLPLSAPDSVLLLPDSTPIRSSEAHLPRCPINSDITRLNSSSAGSPCSKRVLQNLVHSPSSWPPALLLLWFRAPHSTALEEAETQRWETIWTVQKSSTSNCVDYKFGGMNPNKARISQ